MPKCYYVLPDFQNPSGATCSGAKRRQLVALASRYGVLLVEDAPYRLLRYRGTEEPTLYSLAPDRTLHMSSFTKLIAPGVRTGFMIGEPSIIAKLAKVAEDTYSSPGYVAQAITYDWCRRGLLPPQIHRLKALYAPRLDATLAGLDKYMPDATATRPDGGFFISLTLPEGASTTVPAGFDPGKIRLTGNVKGHPPFRGTIAHKGWKAKEVRVPPADPGAEMIIAPADVELS